MPARAQPLLGLRADAGQPPDGERREERPLLPRRDDDEAARLARVARDLRDDLARRDAERAREARRRPHRGPHRLGDAARGEEVGATSPMSRYPSSAPVCSTVGTMPRTVSQTLREYSR